MTQKNPFCYFKTSPEIIRLAAMLYSHFPLSLRNVEYPLDERNLSNDQEAVRFRRCVFGPIFASGIGKQ
ncbi:MAG TPA: IS6 family transposase, partial [Paracoccaceae bacterium]|nr:IS6 family transposase [Paracoccaceae bacterium]